MDTKDVLYKGQNDSLKFIRTPTIFRAGVTDSDEFQRHFHGVALNCGSGSDLIGIMAVVIQKDNFSILFHMNSTTLR